MSTHLGRFESSLTRYTYPESLSSRSALQLSPITDPKRGGDSGISTLNITELFTIWTELHPSRLLPAYAVQAILEIGHELDQTPSQQLARVLCCAADPAEGISRLAAHGIRAPRDLVFASPLIVEEAVVGESLSAVIKLAQSRGWSELPVPFALGVFVSAARALAHLHALGFSHGAISSDAIAIRYANPEPSALLNTLKQGSGALLQGWIQGNLFQLTPEAARYGRGPSADCRALLWTLLELLGGESSLSDIEGKRSPTSVFSGPEADAQLGAERTQSALALLPQTFSAWVIESLRTPPVHMGAMLSQLQRVLDPGQPAFNGPGLSRWISRLAPERVSQWERVLTDLEGQGLQMLTRPGGVLTIHTLPSGHTDASSADISDLGRASAGIPDLDGASAAESKATEADTRESTKSSSTKPTSSPPSPQLDALSTRIHTLKGQLTAELSERLPKRWVAQLNAMSSDADDAPRLRVAVLWLDSIIELHDAPLSSPLTVGNSAEADLSIPEGLARVGLHTLVSPSQDGAIQLHHIKGLSGWVKNELRGERQSWSDASDEISLTLGGMGALTQGDFGLFVQVYQPETFKRRTAPLKSPESFGLVWSLFAAFFAHLLLLLGAYGGREFSPQVTVIAKQERFAEMVELAKERELEEPEEPEAPKPPEEPQPDYQPMPDDQMPEPSAEYESVENQIEQIARERFKGPDGARKLADAIAGDLELDGSLALGDVSSALSSAAEGGLALGSSFGEVGGQVTLGGGGGGSLNTSGGLKGARRAGSLKTKRVSRRVKGRVKTLRSRVRIRGGSLSQAAIYKVINRSQAKIAACYERRLIQSPNLSGTLTVSWQINGRGRVEKVKQLLASVRDIKLKQCVFKVIKRMRFPKPKGGSVKIKYPFVFQRG